MCQMMEFVRWLIFIKIVSQVVIKKTKKDYNKEDCKEIKKDCDKEDYDKKDVIIEKDCDN